MAQANALVLDAFAQGLPDGGFVISFTDVTAERNAARVLQEMNERLEARVAERTTELAAALSAAERANASKSRFVAAASHDLLQPLSAAKLFLGSLEGAQSSVTNEVTLDKVMSALGSVENIIEALLDISKLESGQAAFEVRPVALQTLFNGLRHQLEPLAAQKGLGLRIVDTGAMVMSDPSYLRRILQNLLGNAVRYTESGKVLMGARRDRDALRIEVWDTGPGIPEEFQDEVFREFARLDAPASASEGLGLGLAIVERACAGLGHRITLTSTPGHGTCFSVTVPLIDDFQGTVVTPPRRTERSQATAKGRVVFLVENDEDLRRALCMTLESSGADVIEASNAEAALELLEEIEITPDALLFDEQLGGRMTGTALYQEITERYGTLPVRIISALRCPTLHDTCNKLGVTLLNKPIDVAELDEFLAELANS